MSDLLGDEFKLFDDTASSGAGNYSTPTWTEQVDCGDVGYDTAPEKVEIPKRVGFKMYRKGRSDLSFKFKVNYDPSNTFCKKIVNATNNGTKVHLAIAPGLIAGGGYWHGWFLLTGPVDAALDNPATIDVEASPHADAPSNELPAFVTFA